jgi:hypothetical protein
MPSAKGKVTISVRVDEAIHAKFAAAAKEDGRTIGNWLERAGLTALRVAGITVDSPTAPTPRKPRARRRGA